MYLDLNTLIFETNKKIVGAEPNKIIFKYGEDNIIKVSMGEVVYFFDYQKLYEVLISHNIKLQEEKIVYDLLSKHIINQLMASTGKKIYPEVISLSSDLIK